MDVANGRRMKDKSFESAMQQIAKQAEAEQQLDLIVARRARIMSRVKGAVVFLFLGAAIVTGLCYHVEVQDIIYSKVLPQSSAEGELAEGGGTNATSLGYGNTLVKSKHKAKASIATAQQNAAIRDAIIDQVAK